MNQQTIFEINLGIFRHIKRNVEDRKIRNISGKTSTQRAENIFPKYLLYNVPEIARKYLREKKRYSSFSDSVGQVMPDLEIKNLTFIVMGLWSFHVTHTQCLPVHIGKRSVLTLAGL